MSTNPLTLHGKALLEEELKRLKTKERPEIINAISEARAQGDLSENADYDAAKEKQSFTEGRIIEIELKLATAEIIDPSLLDEEGRVVFGATVDLENLETEEAVTYQIVGEDEASIEKGLISFKSPLARALIGKSTNDIATVETPSGIKEYEIKDVHYI